MKAISSWLWVIIGIVLGIVIFTSSYAVLMNFMKSRQKQFAWEEYDYFFDKIKRTCSVAGIGGLYHHEISVPEIVRAIYAANASDEQPPDKVSVYITSSLYATGDYYCIQYFDDALPECRKLDCKLSMTYMGTPSLKSDLPSLVARLMGGSTVYKFKVDMNKTDYHAVGAYASKIIE